MCKFKSNFLGCLILSLIAGNFTAITTQDKDPIKTIRRVKRPGFSNNDWKDIYFEDLFNEALVGSRKEAGQFGDADSSKQNTRGLNSEINSVLAWSKHVSRAAIEDEIKALHRQLRLSVLTRSKFNSDFPNVRQQFSMLSLLFGIIKEYDKDIRWKKYATAAQSLFAELVVNAETPSKPSFENSKNRFGDLGELIRGGGIEVGSDAPLPLVWPTVVQRRPVMIRLEDAIQESLKPGTSNNTEFGNRKEEIAAQANIVSALSQVLVQTGMDEADDDGYARYALDMGNAARELIQAVGANEFELASAAVNKIEQSCRDCHSEWR